ncbi:MAG: exodeoxyribonuclease VII large subunit [Alistipes communis]
MIAAQYITLSELQRRVRQVLEERFALPLWVSAEIAEVKVNYSGHCYLELVEKGEGDGVPKAQARAVIWRSQYARIAAYFEAETGQRLAAGMRILAKATVNYHELYGLLAATARRRSGLHAGRHGATAAADHRPLAGQKGCGR